MLPPEAAATLPLTGERTVPGVPAENYWFRRHEAAYAHLAPLTAGRTVLEVGCGEGYGTALLGRGAVRIVGLDYDAATIAHAAAVYPQADFVRANLAALPLADASVDAVVTLQVIEHVWDHGQFIRECRRVLRPDGVLVVSTPNRLTFSPGRDQPINPFHTREFTAAELAGLLTGNGFGITSTLGLHAGPRLRALDRAHGSFVDAQLATPPDRWPARLRAEVESVVVADFAVTDAIEIDEALDLLLIAAPAAGPRG